jgi:chromosome segregation ATPase
MDENMQVIIEIKEELSSLRADIKNIFKQLEKQDRKNDMVSNIEKSLERIEEKFDNVTTRLNDHENRLRDLESKPGKLWWTFAAAIATGVGSYIISLIFK